MAETQTLNFGPEWLRALSGGGSVTSPPLSPALPKYKLADYRYGREEMLALYIKDNKIPVDLQDKEFLPILQEEPLPPLALVPFTEEEQRNFSTSVNSAAVLRLMGRGGGTVAVAPRGRSSSRGRGRGRGEGGFYQRSFDDVEGGFGRGAREMHRSQSWEERGDRRFEKPGRKESEVAPAHFQLNHIRSTYEDSGTGATRKHDFTRSESENWRTSRDEQNGEEDDGGWRLAGPRRDGDRWRPHSPDGLRSSGWREHADQRRRFPFDSREEERGYRRSRLGSGGQDDERDSLPEWCLDDADEEMGTFDSSGAFLSLKVRGTELSSLPSRKKAPKEPIPEEAELDFRPSEECEEHSEKEDSEPEETKEADKTAQKEMEAELSGLQDDVAPASSSSAPSKAEPSAEAAPSPSEPERTESPSERSERPSALNMQASTEPSQVACPASAPSSLAEGAPLHHGPHVLPEMAAPPPVTQQTSPEMPSALRASLPFPEATAAIVGAMPPLDMDDDEGLKHFEQEAEKMVAYLQDNTVDDDRLVTKMAERTKPSALPVSHEAALKWFYKDPQGEIQGPFSNQEMVEWFQAGYFAMTLLVKRGCDEVFQPLGEVMKMWGRVPFTPGPSLPPLLGDVDQERLKRQRELTALNLYQLQQLQYQYLLRQQYAQALAQQHKAVALGSAQQQQHQQQLSLLLQQYQALKMRTSEPPVTRSMSVPDSASVWELQNPASQPSGMANIQHAAHGAWESGSVWDLPMDSIPPAPTIEQMQQLEKAKAAKMEQDRREAELQAKRQEDERKRREEEERKRREEEELARRTKEEALRRQREQEAALRRQKEEEERQAQERRREEEERRQREEMLRKQEEERRNQEELRRLEEEKRLAEEAAARQRLQEEQKRKEQEQRRKEQELQRQQQELQRQQELQKQQELQRQRQQQQEALRRLQQQQQQQQQLAQMKLPSSSKWGQQSSSVSSQAQTALSLAEIQKLEEERERQAREEKRQQQELIKALQLQQQQQQQQQQQTKLTGWGNMAKQPATTKSLLEIQQEEAQQMQQQQQKKEQQGGTQPSRASTRASNISNSVWGSVNNSTPQWSASDLGSSIWGSPDTKNSSLGFWDETVKDVAPPAKRNAKNNKSNANLGNSLSSRANKKVEEEEKKLLKLFQGVNNSQDGFTQWCEHTLHALNTANNLDVPTFASFLKEVDSPYEVHDYVRAYLGDTPEAKDFAKHFLERRAKQKPNQQPKQQQKSEPIWGVNQTELQSIFQSNHASLQQSSFETVQSGKKKKKQKMVRADPSILGFSVNAASERLNMGEIETVEDF